MKQMTAMMSKRGIFEVVNFKLSTNQHSLPPAATKESMSHDKNAWERQGFPKR